MQRSTSVPTTQPRIAAGIAAATSASGGVVSYGNTPTRNAENAAAAYLSRLTDGSPRFILLATDGLPTCLATDTPGSDDSAGATAAVEAARASGFPTFVVGISTRRQCGRYAQRHGQRRRTAARGHAELLCRCQRRRIGGGDPDAGEGRGDVYVPDRPCSQRRPTRLDEIDVFGDGAEIPRDTSHVNGYDYTDASMQAIQVYGPLCDRIMRGDIREVTVTFRCIVT